MKTSRIWTMIASMSASTLITLGLLALAGSASAELDVDGLEELLPRHETEAERLVWQDRLDEMPKLDLRDNPPTGPVRNCAEWEPCTGVLIRYPLGLPYDLLRDLDDDVILHVVVSSSYQSTAYSNLSSNGVDMDQVQFLVQSNDSIWTRDYGPWFIFDGNDALGIVDHTYNRPWRPNDNLIPVYFGQQQGIPVYSHSMYHTGGNYMTDGAHISASTVLVYNEASSENGMSQAEVNALMNEYYGIETYTVMDYIESGGIHHIDTWAKFIDEETVIVKEPSSSHATHNDLDQRATLLASLESSTGRNYQVHRIFCYDIGYGDPASYTNSLILNDHIYVPLFGNATHDANALAVYEAAAPGYVVNGYEYSGFLTDDALHCRTKGVMDAGMLRVQHIPVREAQEGDAVIEAFVKAHSGQAITDVTVHYRHGEGTWQTVALIDHGDDTFSGAIPEPAETTTCAYYISASDASGRTEGMPRSQPNANYTFEHSPDLSPVPDAGQALRLDPAWPNPFNPMVNISFELLYPDEVELTVIDARGHLIKTLVSGALGSGTHVHRWDGTDATGRRLASGVYYYRLQAAGLQYTKPITLLK